MTFKEWFRERYGVKPTLILEDDAESALQAAYDAGYDQGRQEGIAVIDKLPLFNV